MVAVGPTSGTAHLSVELLQELIDWARVAAPDESCGILIGDRPPDEGGRALRFHGLRNAAETPQTRYLIDPQEQADVMIPAEDAGEAVWGIFHSHPATPPIPSQTDVAQAFYPDSLYLLCSLADPDHPDVRAWRIRDGQVDEVALEIGAQPEPEDR